MDQNLIDAIEAEVSTNNLLEITEEVWKIDRNYSYPAFAESAAFEAEKMRSWGLDAEVIEAPADGETIVGEWRMPLAWDWTHASLEVTAPEKRKGKVASTDELPTHIVMWSGPTDEGGLEAPLVFVPKANREASFEGRNVQGKVVLVDVDPRGAKMHAVERGAVGIVSFYSPQPVKHPDAVFWVNGWSDDPGGWAYHEGDTPLPAMSISPEQGKGLLEALEAADEVRVRLTVKSRYYKGVLPLATGVYRGRDGREEVLTLGHGQEQGANDNSSGVAVMSEALRVVKALVEKGVLRRPVRSLRALITSECYGTYAFAAMRPEIIQRTIAAINIDSVGHDVDAHGARMNVCLNPHASVHFSDTIAANLYERYLRNKHPSAAFRIKGFSLDDNGIADPLYGVPTVLADIVDHTWHTTADTPDTIDPRTITEVAVMTAYWLYKIASAGELEAREFAVDSAERWLKIAAEKAAKGLKEALAAGRNARAHDVAAVRHEAAYLADRAAAEISTSREVVPKSHLPEHGDFVAALKGAVHDAIMRLADGAGRATRIVADEEGEPLDTTPTEAVDERLVKADEVVPVRNFKGTPCYDSLPKEVRAKAPSPRWQTSLHSCCFWMDGKRTLAEAIRLATLEHNANPLTLLEQIEFMAQHGLIELKRKES